MFFILFVWLGFLAFKSPAVEDILATRSLKELHLTLRKNQQQRFLKTRCQLQLKTGRVPVSCYRWISSLTQITEAGRKEFRQHLDEKCQKGLLTLKTPEEASLLLQTKGLSPFCKEKLKEKRQILIYQLRDRPVQEFLKWHLKTEPEKTLDFPLF